MKEKRLHVKRPRRGGGGAPRNSPKEIEKKTSQKIAHVGRITRLKISRGKGKSKKKSQPWWTVGFGGANTRGMKTESLNHSSLDFAGNICDGGGLCLKRSAKLEKTRQKNKPHDHATHTGGIANSSSAVGEVKGKGEKTHGKIEPDSVRLEHGRRREKTGGGGAGKNRNQSARSVFFKKILKRGRGKFCTKTRN